MTDRNSSAREQAAELLRRASRESPSTVDVDEIASLLDSDDAVVRDDAAQTAARLGSSSSERLLPLTFDLVARLGDECAYVRAHAAMALAAIADAHPDELLPHADACLSRLTDANSAVRGGAVLVLSNLAVAAPDEIEEIVDAAEVATLLADEDRDVRGNSIELIIELAGRGCDGVPDQSVRAELVDRLDDDSWFVRERACLALGVVGDPSDRARLQTRAESDPNGIVRDTAAVAVERLAERR